MPFIGKQSTSNSQITNYTTTVGSGGQTNFTVVIEGGDETHVYLNGVLLKETTDYTVSSTQVSLVSPAVENDIVEIKVFRSFALVDAVKGSGDTMTGELEVPTVKLSSNVIKASDGGSTLTLDTSDNLTVAGNIQVGGNVIKASDGGSTITLDTSDNVTIAGAISANNLVGMIAPFAMSTPPTGWLACDGSTNVSKTTYADLYNALTANDTISNPWGSGDDSSTFALPDLEGAFLRGTGTHNTHQDARENGSAHFAGPSVGSFQDDSFQGHRHAFANYQGGTTPFTNNKEPLSGAGRNPQYADFSVGGVTDPKSDGTNGTPRTGSETRPFNAGVKYCIKY